MMMIKIKRNQEDLDLFGELVSDLGNLEEGGN